ncbi:hypothetical protein EYM_02470 [Ignicoccus islandicus DSM 13165]|uniref:TIGR00266 family protein n=1 Tax=Ignicoccus islandicus DSM 13165 TaxID=940295 RepID=A0A0U3EAT7_9CREN|nr:TIGR00266 family protein [Ignicoccus islandicus]ALU11555.1 hypothetical protein EYM_02470 [Ignicoccus islandicus DSM 13165]
MRWSIEGTAYPVIRIDLEEGEKVYAETGAMMMMKGNLKVDTIMIDLQQERSKVKAVLEAIGRKLLSGETIFHNVFEGPGTVWISPSLPGGIKYIESRGDCWIVQDYSYVAHYGDLDLDLAWKGPKGLVLGDLVWLKLCGEGGFWVSSYGDVIEVNVEDEMIIDNMHFVALPDNAQWEVVKFGNLRNFLLGGEGYVVKVRGPTKVYVQTRILPPLAAAIARFMPSKWSELLRLRL